MRKLKEEGFSAILREMKGYVGNIEQATEENEFFRQVIFTGPNSQLVVMALQPGEEIGEEVHVEHDQFLRIEEGHGWAVLEGQKQEIFEGFGVVVPAGVKHNIINSQEGKMKLYTIYSPPEHPDKTVHKTKAEAMAAEH